MKLRSRHLLRKRKYQKGLMPLKLYLSRIPLEDNLVVRPAKDVKFNVPSRRIVGRIPKILEVSKRNMYKVKIDNKVYNIPRAHLKHIE